MSLPRYESYRDSGVKWLGEVPEHWEIVRLRYLCKIETGDADTVDSNEDGAYPFFVRSPNIEKINRYTHDCEAILTAGDGVGVGKVFHYFDGKFCAHQRVYIFRQFEGVQGKFFFHYLKELFLRVVLEGTAKSTVDSLRRPMIADFLMTVPYIEEQSKITKFLDQETAKIDNLITEQQRLIELLKEKRQAVISHAVTKGLNPDVPMKDSGVEWLGEVPAHWEIVATKRLFNLVCIPAPKSHNYELLSIYTAIGVRPRKELEQKGNKATSTDGYWMVNKGDLIVNKLLAWMGAIGISEYDGVTSPAYDILRKRLSLQPKYYDFLFRCGICFSEFRRYSRGIMDMRLRLYFNEFGRLLMPYPPEDEQEIIINFLEYELNKFDILILESSKVISLLKERRSALISSAVTGKIDVRNFVSTQPQVETVV